MDDPRRLIDLLERIGGLFRNEQRRFCSGVDLQPVHLQVLSYISRCNRYSDTPAAVTNYLGATKGTISQSLLILEREGYLAKDVDTKDRRVIHLKLTKKAKRLLEEFQRSFSLQIALNKLDKKELENTEQSLETILKNLQQANKYRTFGQCHTCKHFKVEAVDKFRCGLTNEPLSKNDSIKICQEHELFEKKSA